MRLLLTAVVLAWAGIAFAQLGLTDTPAQAPAAAAQAPAPSVPAARPAAPARPQEAAKSVAVPPNAPIVTLQGVCPHQQEDASSCKTVITRQELDSYVNAFAPDAADPARARMAIQYARTVALSSLAQQQGLDKNPAVVRELEYQLKLTRMRVLATALSQTMQASPASIAETDIQDYYNAHKERYEQVQVRRLAVPFLVPTETGKPLDREAVKTELEALRKRAVAGEDMNLLQQEAFKHLNIQSPAPPVNLVAVRRGSVQGVDEKIFNLNAGEVSEVLEQTAALAIVKIESKDVIPLQSTRQEIERNLRMERSQDQMAQLGKKVHAQFDLQYLGLQTEPDLFGPMVFPPSASRMNTRRPSPRPRQ